MLSRIAFRGLLRAACLTALTAGAPPFAAAAASPPLAFAGAHLGMSRADWRAAPPPGPISAHTRAACSDDRATVGFTPNAEERAARLVTCGYLDAFGSLSLPVTFPFAKTAHLDHLRYGFAGDRLVRIQAEASLDAYNALVADLTHRYGAPKSLFRDTVGSEIGPLPRVTLAWTTPGGEIRLVDPALPRDEIALTMTATTAAHRP